MRVSLLPKLACPMGGGAKDEPGLKLIAWRVEDESGEERKSEPGGTLWVAPAELTESDEKAEPLAATDCVIEGALIEPTTGHWYAIDGGIPHMVRRPLRYRDLDEKVVLYLQSFSEKFRYAVSPCLVTEPLALERNELTDEHLHLLDEDRYWGGFFKLHWDAGDRSIFDMDAKASHPTFWPAGVREPDDRDLHRRWGVWPDHLGRWLFDDMAAWGREAAEAHAAANVSGEPWAWDAGCGGGQFAIQAARSGYCAVGTDIATEALACGLARSREAGVPVDYIRAENARPPFREAAFRLVLCKDTIHHEPDVAATLDAWTRTMAPGARVLFYEHHGANKLAAKMLERAAKSLIPRIKRRYPVDAEISPFFQTESANEDAGRDEVKSELLARFPGAAWREEVRFYHDLEAMLWYAFVKWRRPALLVSGAARALDPLLRAIGGPQYFALRGQWHPKS